MPVRNAAPFLDAAVRSILGQTASDFEFVVVDDASTDGSSEMLATLAARDARLRVVRSGARLGLVGSSNAAVRASRAPLVARMDADDIAHPERLARQRAIFERDADVALVGTAFEGMDAAGRTVRTRDRWRLLRSSPYAPFPHGSIMFRRTAFDAIGGYRAAAELWEDLDLFRRLATQGRVIVLPDALYRYRFHARNARTVEAHAATLRAMVRMRAHVDPAWRSGLSDGAGDAACGLDDPRLLYSVVATQLWAGHDPLLWPRLRWRMLVSPDLHVPAIFGLAGAAAVSPRAARFVLASIIAVRDRLAGLRVGREPREWHFV